MDDIIQQQIYKSFRIMNDIRESVKNTVTKDKYIESSVFDKTCSKKSCRSVYPATLEFWHRNNLKSDGLHKQCKFCRNDYNRKMKKRGGNCGNNKSN